MWDNCLLCSKSTPVPPNDPSTTLIQARETSSLTKLQHKQPWCWTASFKRCLCFEGEDTPLAHTWQHIKQGKGTSCLPGHRNAWNGAAERICLASRANLSRQHAQLRRAARLMASPWQQQLGNYMEQEETSVGIFPRLHASQGTCVHLKILVLFPNACACAPVNASWQPIHAQGNSICHSLS